MSGGKSSSYDIGPLLRHAHVKAAHAFNAALEPLGIQGKHFGVLLVLHQQGPVNQRQLTDRLGSDKSGMVRMIDDLEARGICQRRPDPTDRRAHSVELTPAGHELFAAAERTAAHVSTDLLGEFTNDERDQLVELLRRFVSTDRSTSSQASPARPGKSPATHRD